MSSAELGRKLAEQTLVEQLKSWNWKCNGFRARNQEMGDVKVTIPMAKLYRYILLYLCYKNYHLKNIIAKFA